MRRLPLIAAVCIAAIGSITSTPGQDKKKKNGTSTPLT